MEYLIEVYEIAPDAEQDSYSGKGKKLLYKQRVESVNIPEIAKLVNQYGFNETNPPPPLPFYPK